MRENDGGYRMAVGVTLVAGVFSVAVSVMLMVNYYQLKVYDPLHSVAFMQLKEQLKGQPSDEPLKQEIRALDLKLREEYFSRQQMNDSGFWLLVIGAAVMVGAMKFAAREKRGVPMPEGEMVAGEVLQQASGKSRVLVGVVGVAAVGGGVLVTGFGGVGNDYQGLIAAIEAEAQEQAEVVVEEVKLSTYATLAEMEMQWPRFRGPGGDGVARVGSTVTKWDGTSGEGILWKSPINLPGDSSPVVWDDRVFVTGAKGNQRVVYCFNADSGAMLWQRRVDNVEGSSEEQPELLSDSVYAAATAATDGRRVYAVFANGDLAAFDYEGNRLWDFAFGLPENSYGHATSLMVYENVLIVQFDQGYAEDMLSVIIGFDCETGDILWDVERDVNASWATPTVATIGGRDHVIVLAEPYAIGYDPLTGETLWECEAVTGEIASSAVISGSRIVIVTPEDGLRAVDVTGSDEEAFAAELVWENSEIVPDVTSPLVDGERIYLLTSEGTLAAMSLADGGLLWQQDYDEFMFQSSPTLVGENIYITATDGTTIIFKAGDAYKEVGRCLLGETVNSSPAVFADRIYVRGRKHVYALGDGD